MDYRLLLITSITLNTIVMKTLQPIDGPDMFFKSITIALNIIILLIVNIAMLNEWRNRS